MLPCLFCLSLPDLQQAEELTICALQTVAKGSVFQPKTEIQQKFIQKLFNTFSWAKVNGCRVTMLEALLCLPNSSLAPCINPTGKELPKLEYRRAGLPAEAQRVGISLNWRITRAAYSFVPKCSYPNSKDKINLLLLSITKTNQNQTCRESISRKLVIWTCAQLSRSDAFEGWS